MADESLTNNSPKERTHKPCELPSFTTDEFSGITAGQRMVRTVKGVEFAFRWCPAGTFLMGSPEGELGRNGDYNEEKQHRVTLSQGFWMLETEVTVGMYRAFETDSGYRSQGNTPYGCTGRDGWKQSKIYSWENPGFSQDETHPVTCVSWTDAAAFSEWLGKQLGMNVQLPTEAQWEYACRAGTTGAYAGDLDAMGWYRNNSDSTTHAVGQKKPNDWGLYDMHGNVWEWCSDYWKGDLGSKAVTDPTGPKKGARRVYRGGSWNLFARGCRSAIRFENSPKYRGYYLGFRVSMVPDK